MVSTIYSLSPSLSSIRHIEMRLLYGAARTDPQPTAAPCIDPLPPKCRSTHRFDKNKRVFRNGASLVVGFRSALPCVCGGGTLKCLHAPDTSVLNTTAEWW